MLSHNADRTSDETGARSRHAYGHGKIQLERGRGGEVQRSLVDSIYFGQADVCTNGDSLVSIR